METSAIIGGTGVYQVPGLDWERRTVETEYGTTDLLVGQGESEGLVFLPRHGPEHTVPPHRINYRANIKALQKLDVRRVLAIYTVGSLHSELPPASMVLLSSFLDFTRSRPSTFYDGDDGVVAHVDVTHPYCPALRTRVLERAAARGLELVPDGVYACMEGPRLETAAEITMLARLGGDVVGMTGVPEVTLARELGICFAAVALVVNWGAGLVSETIDFDEARAVCDQAKLDILALFVDIFRNPEPYLPCRCADALRVVGPH
ncbi:MAG TPA: S-methyl-5'-thioinosine phosphorylase [Anaerolineae bacterium]|nr:S-methyl-5'-thioinosine phosphorylase [Anaerolineae bacterium]